MSRKRHSHTFGRGCAVRCVAVACVCLCMFVVYRYVVAPFAPRWLALYGNQYVPEGYSVRGIDVSHHQGCVDWEVVSRAHIGEESISFVFLKVTEGVSVVDRMYAANVRKARECGFVCGAYHYFSPRVPARRQAEWFVRHADVRVGDLPPVLDIEDAGSLSVDEVRAAAREWLRIVERRYGVKPIIYTYHKFRERYLDTEEFRGYPYWIAHYYVRKVQYRGQWCFWQHTDCGRLLGIEGDVDFNVFNGSLSDMRRLCVGGGK